MINSIPYISPSMFYYWNKCPLKAVFNYEYKNTQFFPKHPDADLGNIIHRFYENKNKWNIKNRSQFNTKWNKQVADINYEYANNPLQSVYFPIQWHSSYYAVKKQLLLKQLLKHSNRTQQVSLKIKREKWIEDENKIIAGKIDMLIYDNSGNIVEIVDYKTGNIYEKQNGKLIIKNAYKTQLALYAKAVINTQGTKPILSLINLSGKKVIIDYSDNYIEQVYLQAKVLKDKINTALFNGNFTKLANPNAENCHMCKYRSVCNAYKNKFMNVVIKNNIDLKGKVKKINVKIFEIETNNGELYRIINTRGLNVSNNKMAIVYNLYFPEKENKLLYTQKNTIINYE